MTSTKSVLCVDESVIVRRVKAENTHGANDIHYHPQLHRKVAEGTELTETNELPNLESCGLVMAPSSLLHDKAGWGVFTLHDHTRGQPVTPAGGDPVVHLIDPNPDHLNELNLAIYEYFWGGQDMGGAYEGQYVLSHVPGIGMLANGLPHGRHNVLPSIPTYDEGGLNRLASPGAGAITHYHNMTFYFSKDVLPAGSELFVNNGGEWFEERMKQLHGGELSEESDFDAELHDRIDGSKSANTHWARDLSWLNEHGLCLDNVRPGASHVPHAGRGAFAVRNLAAESIVLPVPVLFLPNGRASMEFAWITDEDTLERTHQLLLNYCLGHPDSTVLLLPYGPGMSLVNHAPRPEDANVQLRWSQSETLHTHGQSLLQVPLDELREYGFDHSPGFLLELVATRDIAVGEEILLHYGSVWQDAWNNHVLNWEPEDNAENYTPSRFFDDANQTLPTYSELASNPYPDNIFTSCYYRYSDHKEEAEHVHAQSHPGGGRGNLQKFLHPLYTQTSAPLHTFPWKQHRRIYDLRNLRPCRIIERDDSDPIRGTAYTVRIFNRPGLDDIERIPSGQVHLVNAVPRHAIRFSDKMYSTDQHLSNAFRHYIGMEDGIHGSLFPEHWKDLLDYFPEEAEEADDEEEFMADGDVEEDREWEGGPANDDPISQLPVDHSEL